MPSEDVALEPLSANSYLNSSAPDVPVTSVSAVADAISTILYVSDELVSSEELVSEELVSSDELVSVELVSEEHVSEELVSSDELVS